MAVVPTVITVILEAVDAIKLIMADIRESGTDTHVAHRRCCRQDGCYPGRRTGSRVGAASAPSAPQANAAQAAAMAVRQAATVCPSTPIPSPAALQPEISRLGEILVNRWPGLQGAGSRRMNTQQHQGEPENSLGRNSLQAKAITERALDRAPQTGKAAQTGRGRCHDPSRNRTARQCDESGRRVGPGSQSTDQDRHCSWTES